MYKTAIITDEVSQDLATAAALANAFKLDALEIRSVNEKSLLEMNNADFREIKRVADDRGLEICALATSVFKCSLDDENAYRAHMEGLKRCVEAAKLWNSKIIRTFTFWNTHNGTCDFDRIADKYQEAIQVARDGGVVLAIESEPSVCTSNIARLVQFLKNLSSDVVGALYDPGNEIADHQAPPPYPVGYECLKPFIKHVHLKDLRQTETGFEPALIGRGDVNFYGVINSLKVDGYQGYVSVETHFRYREQVKEALMRQPRGSEFSRGGESASRDYLTILKQEYNWQGE